MCWIFLYCFHTNTRLIRCCLLFIRLNLNHQWDFKCFKPRTDCWSFCRSYPRITSIPLLCSLSGFALQVLTEKCKLLSMKMRFWPPDLLVKTESRPFQLHWAFLRAHGGAGRRTGGCCRCSAGLADGGRGGGCALRCASRPSAQTLVFRPPSRISPPEGTRTATGLLPAMSSLLGVVRKQLKSHPAVSDPPARFRPSGAVTLKAPRRTRVRYWSHQNHLMCHHLIES